MAGAMEMTGFSRNIRPLEARERYAVRIPNDLRPYCQLSRHLEVPNNPWERDTARASGYARAWLCHVRPTRALLITSVDIKNEAGEPVRERSVLWYPS